MIFVDEKTFHGGHVKRGTNTYGYAEKGVRVPIRCVNPQRA